MVIRRKFSAIRFWDESCEYRTLFQYIGELCRYLLNAPLHPRETQYCGRSSATVCGRNLAAVPERFAIPQIVEFYRRPKAMCRSSMTTASRAVGRIPHFMRNSIKTRSSGSISTRGDAGARARRLLHRMRRQTKWARRSARSEDGAAGPQFRGLHTGATEKKILRDVFERGDAWFRTGDLMRDERGYYYFVDRIGDTFRWKGENVATSEVSEALACLDGILEANVYGVSVPGMDGRAGMAAIVTDGALDLAEFRAHLARRLPPYARPKFLRVADRIATTSTFKHTKSDLARDGFDPAATTDPIYLDDAAKNAFVPLDGALYARIKAGDDAPLGPFVNFESFRYPPIKDARKTAAFLNAGTTSTDADLAV